MSATVSRRLRTIPILFGSLAGVTLFFPFLAGIAVTVDGIRFAAGNQSFMATRMLAFLWIFLASEALGLLVAGGQWVLSGGGRARRLLEDWSYGLQAWWASLLWGALRRLLGVRLVVDGAEALTPGPIIAFFRHASIVDNLLPAVVLSARHGIRLRWVLKQELLSDPALDVVGSRLPNYFVSRDSADPAAEIGRVAALARDLTPTDGVLIYPEGTRFTPEKRQRALARLAEGDPDIYRRARQLCHVLPPRLGGPLALLDAGVDVVICAHRGLDGLSHLSNIWSGRLLGTEVEVKMWRVPHSQIPTGRPGRVAWLYEQWQQVDDWIGRP